jgi:hypothetical protein
MIFSNKLDAFWTTTLFLYQIHSNYFLPLLISDLSKLFTKVITYC